MKNVEGIGRMMAGLYLVLGSLACGTVQLRATDGDSAGTDEPVMASPETGSGAEYGLVSVRPDDPEFGIYRKGFRIPEALSPEDVRKGVLLGATVRRGSPVDDSPGRIAIAIEARSTRSIFTFTIEGAELHMYEKTTDTKVPTEEVRMDRWSANLAESVQEYLDILASNRTHPPEVLDDDPENLAAGDNLAAGTRISVPRGLTLGDIQDALVQTGLRRKYTIVARTHGFVALRLHDNGIIATYKFSYDDEFIVMHVEAHKASGKRADVSGWTKYMIKTLEKYLDRKTL